LRLDSATKTLCKQRTITFSLPVETGRHIEEIAQEEQRTLQENMLAFAKTYGAVQGELGPQFKSALENYSNKS
jgi:hypothetical protein